VYINFKILKVEVFIIFSGTWGFPVYRDGRYYKDKEINYDGSVAESFKAHILGI
jgi:hypothetical protein